MYRSPLGPVLLRSVVARGLSLLDIDPGSDASWIRVRIVNRMARSGRAKGVKPFFFHLLPIISQLRGLLAGTLAAAARAHRRPLLRRSFRRTKTIGRLVFSPSFRSRVGISEMGSKVRENSFEAALFVPPPFPRHSSELDEKGFGPLDSSSQDLLRPPLDGGDFEMCGSPLRWPCFDRSDSRRGAPVTDDRRKPNWSKPGNVVLLEDKNPGVEGSSWLGSTWDPGCNSWLGSRDYGC
ncbi:hypothetical protein GQ457_01G013990 [Hibiscus cannabinus]